MANESKKNEGQTCTSGRGDLYEQRRYKGSSDKKVKQKIDSKSFWKYSSIIQTH
jgi:hypothetical protein